MCERVCVCVRVRVRACVRVFPVSLYFPWLLSHLHLGKLRRRRGKKTTEEKTKTERKELHPLTVDPSGFLPRTSYIFRSDWRLAADEQSVSSTMAKRLNNSDPNILSIQGCN